MSALASSAVTADRLLIDAEQETERIVVAMRDVVRRTMRRQGAIVGVSGGIDSAVTLALCARAFGPQRTRALLMPEADSSADTLHLSRSVAEAFGVEAVLEDITPILAATRCYERRDEAVRSVVPGYGAGWRFKIVLPSVLGTDAYRMFRLVAESPDGERHEARLPAPAYLTIVAATNFKQRVRKTMDYFHADRLNYAVVGTPNRLEYELGFFVKLGDGAADVEGIEGMYKSELYVLAKAMGVDQRVIDRTPTTDTLPAQKSQKGYFYGLDFATLDTALQVFEESLPLETACQRTGLTEPQMKQLVENLRRRNTTTTILRSPPLGIGRSPIAHLL